MDPFTAKRIGSIVNGYINQKIPSDMRTSVRLTYEIQDWSLTLTEERSSVDYSKWERAEIAQFRLEDNKWRVYAKDSKKNWMQVTLIDSDENFEKQLEQVEVDQQGMFWAL